MEYIKKFLDLSFFNYDTFLSVYHIYLEITGYFMLGVIFMFIFGAFVPSHIVFRYFTSKKMGVIYAAIFGIPLPLCSCSVIPTAKYLKKNNASTGSIVSFLLSTPVTGLDSMMVYQAFFGWYFTFFRAISAFFVGILGGFLTQIFFKEKSADSSKGLKKNIEIPFKDKIRQSFQDSFFNFINKTYGNIFIGFIITVFLLLVLPEDFLVRFKEYPFLMYFMVLLVSLPLYICATASIPVAFMLYAKGLSLGASFVFITAGPIISFASFLLLKNNLFQGKLLYFYIGYATLASLFLGFIVDFFHLFPNIPRKVLSLHDMGFIASLIPYLSFIFTFFVIWNIIKNMRKSVKIEA